MVSTITLYIFWFIIGTISFLLLVVLLLFFGKIILLQMKIWLLAKRGFHQVEHIGTDRVRRYFYLRPRDNKFDFLKGFYLHIPETTTKVGDVMKGVPKFYKNKILKDDVKSKVIDKSEYEGLAKVMSGLIYKVDAVTLRWGIPTITYVGNDPNPVYFAEREKVYGAQVFRDVYLRLLTTQKYDEFRKWLKYAVFGIMGLVVVLILYYLLFNSSQGNLGICLNNLDNTKDSLVGCVNNTAKLMVQVAKNSTITI
jgi:hypothetical protein